MKFVVIQGYNNEVDVKLHWETKSKIKKIAARGLYIGVVVASVVIIRTKNSEESQED